MNIDFIKRRLLVKYPLFGSVIANSHFIEESSVGTVETDFENIYYNPRFVESLTDEQQIFVFAHQICHIAFNHIFRSEGRDKELWDIATDAVVNANLKKDGLSIIEGEIDIPEAIHCDAEELYQKLLDQKRQKNQSQTNDSGNQDKQSNVVSSLSQNGKHQQENQSQANDSESQEKQSNVGSSLFQNGEHQQENQGQANDSESQEKQSNVGSSLFQNGEHQQENQSQTNDSESQEKQSNVGSSSNFGENGIEKKQDKNYAVGHDTHSMWDKAIEKKHREKHLQSDSKSSSDKKSLSEQFSKMFDKEKGKQFHEKQTQKENKEIEKMAELGEKEVFKQNKIERKKQLEELRKLLVHKSHGYGNDTNCESRNITDIGISTPLIDWRRLLKEAVKYDIDWSYQNAGIEDGVVTAHLEEIPISETEIVLDTSGSIHEILLRNFLRECKNILQTSKVKVGCFDTKFYGFTEIKDVSDIDKLPFYGGGGTNFEVAVNAFTRRVENKIIFTDGRAPMPSTSIDVIWIVFGGIKINPVGGRVIYIDDAQLERLQRMNEAKGKIR